jgi:hypothetical protein
MRQIEYFVPGDPGEDEGIVPWLRWSIPRGVAQTYAETYTDPGEVVLVPYCQGPAVVRETLAAGRRVLALNFDPLLMLVVQVALSPVPARELDAAVARLGDSPKQGIPLRRYLTDLYATTCPACLRPAVADYFVWDREQGVPVAKHLRCPACAWDGRTAIEQEDRERLAEIPVRGMQYHYVLDRVVPKAQADALPARVEPLLELYSPRNLYALAELTLKIESLFPAGPPHWAMKALLLDCLDRCSSMTPLPGSTARRRGLSRPGRFLERNVWVAFEDAVSRLQAASGDAVTGLADTLEAFHASGEKWAGFVGPGLVRDLVRTLPPRSVRLILTSPPALDSAAWSLSYLWGAWLLGADAVAPLRPLLRQRTPDPAWYARVMAGSFGALADLLRDDGRLALILSKQRPAVVEALLLAASNARLGVASLVQSGTDYRLELAPTFTQPIHGFDVPVPAQLQQATAQAVADTIRMRGEPVPRLTLHAAIQRRLAEQGLLAKALQTDGEGLSPFDLVAEQVETGLENPAFVQLVGGEGGEELWWLAEPSDMAPPLCDRVEVAAHQVLQDHAALAEREFTRAIYARFPGPLTPAPALVVLLLQTYGHETTPGCWQLRPEDLLQARQAGRQTMIEHLLALGQRLGYRTEPYRPFDVVWFQGEQIEAVFIVRWQAALGEALQASDWPEAARRYLVIPGGRAALVNYKLAHNPLWQQAVSEARWQFIKYRHVRQLVGQPEVDEYALQTIVGLDPIVEQEQVQLPLF